MILSFVCQCKLDSVTLLLGKQDSPTSIGSVSKEELKTQSVEDLRCRIKTIKSVAMVKKCDRVWLDQVAVSAKFTVSVLPAVFSDLDSGVSGRLAISSHNLDQVFTDLVLSA